MGIWAKYLSSEIFWYAVISVKYTQSLLTLSNLQDVFFEEEK